jgi:hypothetical protein
LRVKLDENLSVHFIRNGRYVFTLDYFNQDKITNRGTIDESQWIVRQAYSHTYSTTFHNKVVYNGFLILSVE